MSAYGPKRTGEEQADNACVGIRGLAMANEAESKDTLGRHKRWLTGQAASQTGRLGFGSPRVGCKCFPLNANLLRTLATKSESGHKAMTCRAASSV